MVRYKPDIKMTSQKAMSLLTFTRSRLGQLILCRQIVGKMEYLGWEVLPSGDVIIAVKKFEAVKKKIRHKAQAKDWYKKPERKVNLLIRLLKKVEVTERPFKVADRLRGVESDA